MTDSLNAFVVGFFVFPDIGETMAENTEFKPPRTLRAKLEQDRAKLYEIRGIIFNAVTELIGGAAVVSYSLQNRSCTKTRADLGSLKTYLRELDDQISEIEAILSSRPLRQRSVHTYISPANTIPPFLW